MNKRTLRKIQRVEKFYVSEKSAKGLKTYGPYWRGVWYEDGKEKRVYVGKELPKSLKYLVEGRYKRPGCKNYTWPGRKGEAGK